MRIQKKAEEQYKKLRDLNLDEHEKGKGHTIEKHVGKTEEYIDYRLNVEKQPKASTYKTMKDAENAVGQVLDKNKDEILNWLKDPSDKAPKPFSAPVNNVEGYVKYKGDQTWKPAGQKATVVLRKTKDGVEILTSYIRK